MAYAGQYTNESYGDAVLTLSGDTLVMQLPGNIRVKLKHWDYDNFEGNYEYAWWDKSLIKFSIDEDGKVSQFDKDGAVYTLKK